MVIFGPMLHVGWASAWSTVTPARSAASRPRNGPPDAVSTTRARRRVPDPARRHMCTAQCSLSTGMSSAPGVSRTVRTTGPAAINDSLFARASRFPASKVAIVTDSPAKPTTPFTTTSAVPDTAAMASGPASTATPAGSSSASSCARPASAMATTRGCTRCAWAASSSTELPAPNATISKRSGCAATTSSVWVPMDPVEPSTATVVMSTSSYRSTPPDHRRGRTALRKRSRSRCRTTRSRSTRSGGRTAVRRTDPGPPRGPGAPSPCP